MNETTSGREWYTSMYAMASSEINRIAVAVSFCSLSLSLSHGSPCLSTPESEEVIEAPDRYPSPSHRHLAHRYPCPPNLIHLPDSEIRRSCYIGVLNKSFDWRRRRIGFGLKI